MSGDKNKPVEQEKPGFIRDSGDGGELRRESDGSVTITKGGAVVDRIPQTAAKRLGLYEK